MHQASVLNAAALTLPEAPRSVPRESEPLCTCPGLRLAFSASSEVLASLSVKLITGFLVNKVCDFYLIQAEARQLAILKDGGDKKDGQAFLKMPGENNSEYGNLDCLVISSLDVTIIRLGIHEGGFKCSSE